MYQRTDYPRWCPGALHCGHYSPDSLRGDTILFFDLWVHSFYLRGDGTQQGRRQGQSLKFHADGQMESGIIDALYLHQGVWTIVEFKTDRVRDEADFKRLLSEEDYVTQVQRYVAAMEHLLGHSWGWPVELDNVVHRAVESCQRGLVEIGDIVLP